MAVIDHRYTVIIATRLFSSPPRRRLCGDMPVTEGDTLDEARAMARDAIRLYLASLQADGLPIPPSEEHQANPIREEIVVAVELA